MIANYAAKLNMAKMPAYYQIFVLDTKHVGDFDGLGKKYNDRNDRRVNADQFVERQVLQFGSDDKNID